MKYEKIEDKVEYLAQTILDLTKLIENLQDCLVNQIEINKIVNERIQGVENARSKTNQINNYTN